MARALVHRSLRRSAWGRTLSQALRIRESGRYLRAEAMPGTRGPRGEYTVRGSGVRVVLRHGTSDTRMFDEVFCARVYAPPAAVTATLAALGRPPRVVDLGANVGLSSADAAARWPGAEITAIEADPVNLPILERCAALNASARPWTVIGAAADVAVGSLRFVSGAGAESHAAHESETATSVAVRAVDAFDHLAHADLVKIDIEGGEWRILADARLSDTPIRALVLEHHGRMCPSRDPRATARELLEAAGFATAPGGPEHLGVGTVWAWR